MFLKRLIVGEMQANCYIVADDKKVMVIDPGGEGERILKIIRQNLLKVLFIVNTHAHIDHIGANDLIRKETGAPLFIHSNDVPFLKSAELNFSKSMGNKMFFSPADKTIKEGEKIKVGRLEFKVIHTPGHTPGSICLYGEGVLFSGDTLFANFIGRADFTGGNFEALKNSLLEKLLKLPDEVIVYPGHGPKTTIGKERKTNPFINEFLKK